MPETPSTHGTPANAAGRGVRVTVVVPTYNRAEWVGRALESVLAQTYREFDLVVSDNCSTDGTRAVVGRFDDPRLRYVRRDRHLGLNEHYNLCIAEVATEYFLIVPDDDELLPEAIETLVPVLDAHGRAGIAHGRARLEQDGVVVSPAHDMTGLARDAVEAGPLFVRRAIAASHRVHATTVLYRTWAVQPVPLDARDYPATEFGVWLRLALDWDIAFVARTLAVYRMHGASYTSANAAVTGGGYIQTPDTITNIYGVKLRFLSEHGARLEDPASLRREASRAHARQLVNWAGHATLPERRLGATVRALAECVRRERRVLLQLGVWRLLVGAVLGERLAEKVKRRIAGRSAVGGAVTR